MIAVGECLCGGVRFEVTIECAKTETTTGQIVQEGSKQNDVAEKEEEERDTNMSNCKKYPSSPAQILICNCSMCRRASGAAFLPFAAFHREKIVFKNQESLKTFQSSERIERGFCGNCGAQVYVDSGEANTLWLTLGLIKNFDEAFKDVLRPNVDKENDILSGNITYTGCHVFADSREQKLSGIIDTLPQHDGYGLYVHDPCEEVKGELTGKKPQGGNSHEDWKEMFSKKH